MASESSVIPADIPNVPPGLKVIRPYVKVGIELSRRDPVVAYHCFSYAMKAGLKTEYRKNPDMKGYLMKLMDFVENLFTSLNANPQHKDDISDDLSGHMLVESTASKLFNWADSQDRNAVFNKHVVKSYYTSSILFDILEIFKDGISEDCATQRKYARWKATYIHNCLKNNETPIPGPIGGDDVAPDEADQTNDTSTKGNENEYAAESHGSNEATSSNYSLPSASHSSGSHQEPANDPQAPQEDVSSTPQAAADISYPNMEEAKKLCKFAGSALQYDDTDTAIGYLEKCLRILKTGQ